ncbi:TIGR04282 family arsenosugar biosynthesis glycosyltransferase [Flavobacteriales bacterium]|nr:TIGR04282 family arsenosugar biosynthesis glycosyltransferase [Flavobacteriales bacterium]
MSKNLIIILTKNPELGKGKSRLAETVGRENALIVFKELIKHTVFITKNLDCDKWVLYSDYIGDNEYFEDSIYSKHLQEGIGLGERMRNAFVKATDDGFDKVMMIGSDCYLLTQNELEKGFKILDSNDFVFGPAEDGGYYLIGTTTTFTKVFDNKTWSTATVLYEAIRDVENADLTFGELATLSDVDYEEDLGELKKFIS